MLNVSEEHDESTVAETGNVPGADPAQANSGRQSSPEATHAAMALAKALHLFTLSAFLAAHKSWAICEANRKWPNVQWWMALRDQVKLMLMVTVSV